MASRVRLGRSPRQVRLVKTGKDTRVGLTGPVQQLGAQRRAII
jgi:hypothetical protein